MHDDFEEYFVPHRFEEVCRQYLVRQNRAGKIPEIFSEIGKYWYVDSVTHTNGELDIVTRDPRVPAHFAAFAGAAARFIAFEPRGIVDFEHLYPHGTKHLLCRLVAGSSFGDYRVGLVNRLE